VLCACVRVFLSQCRQRLCLANLPAMMTHTHTHTGLQDGGSDDTMEPVCSKRGYHAAARKNEHKRQEEKSLTPSQISNQAKQGSPISNTTEDTKTGDSSKVDGGSEADEGSKIEGGTKADDRSKPARAAGEPPSIETAADDEVSQRRNSARRPPSASADDKATRHDRPEGQAGKACPRWVGGSWGTELAAGHKLALYEVFERRRNSASVTGTPLRKHMPTQRRDPKEEGPPKFGLLPFLVLATVAGMVLSILSAVSTHHHHTPYAADYVGFNARRAGGWRRGMKHSMPRKVNLSGRHMSRLLVLLAALLGSTYAFPWIDTVSSQPALIRPLTGIIMLSLARSAHAAWSVIFGDCTFTLGAEQELLRQGSCSTQGGTLDLKGTEWGNGGLSPSIKSLPLGVFDNMGSLR